MVLAVLAATSYVTATFMVEAIAGVNALKKLEPKPTNDSKGGDEIDDDDDDDRMETEFMPLMVPTQVLCALLVEIFSCVSFNARDVIRSTGRHYHVFSLCLCCDATVGERQAREAAACEKLQGALQI